MDRRTFLGLVWTPALASLLQACAHGDDVTGDGANGHGDGFGFVSSSEARVAATQSEAMAGAHALNLFGADAYRKLAASPEPNIVFSPVSVMLALAMTRAGAAGATATEMDDVLHTSSAADTDNGFHRAVNALTATLAERSGEFDVGSQRLPVDVSIANSLWGQREVTWKPRFLDLLAREYGAGMRTVDFGRYPDQARRAINGWVSTETDKRIPELLGENLITTDIRLVLVNAIHMKAPWLQPFAQGSTVDATFNTRNGASVQVPMMSGSHVRGYARGDRWQAVEIDYVGGNLAMLVIVPDEGKFDSVESSVASGMLDVAVRSLEPTEVNLRLPKFVVESRTDLKPALRSLGMTAAFDPSSADLSGMTDDVDLFVSFVVHQATITVDEKGTEAAAATAVGAGVTASPVEQVKVDVDRPFLLAVRDRPTGAVLFLGRVGDPR